MISAFENRTSAFELPSSPDDGRKFTELYNVQHLQRSQREAVRHRSETRRVDARERIDQSAQLDRVSRVCISTIQRLYSMLRGFVFVFLKMFTVRCDQHAETGISWCAWHEARHRDENGARPGNYDMSGA